MTASETAMVDVRGVSKIFGSARAVDRASLSLAKGKFLTILGPSGCGKTTLLRMIAGFLQPDEGDIVLNSKPVSALPPHKRSIGMVFQKLALFPHMTAAQNVAYPLKMRRFPATDIPGLVKRYLSLVKLDGFEDRRPHELSGGQQQRVAIARSLVFSPDLLLLDEPLSALDKKLREEMQLEFRRIQQELGVTTINVTHDQREALVMSDQIVVMKDGVIQQIEDPVGMYRAPSNRFVAGFIGLTAFVEGVAGEVEAGEPNAGGPDDGSAARQRVQVGDKQLVARVTGPQPAATGTPVECALRAEQVRISSSDTAHADLCNKVAATVQQRIFEGDRIVYELRCDELNGALLYAFDHDPAHCRTHDIGEAVTIGWNARDLMMFVKERA